MQKIFVLALVFILSACGNNTSNSHTSGKPKQYKWRNEILGIPYKISYLAPSGKDFQQEIDSIINRFIHLFSEKNPHSVVSEINQHLSHEITDNAVIYVLQQAQSLCAETQQAFDITIKPLYDLFKEYSYTELLDKEIDTNYYKTFIGCEKLELSPQNDGRLLLKKDNEKVKITLGGIYKGFVVDEVAKYLKNKNIKTYYIELGRTPHVKCSGEMNHQWNVIIKEPNTDSSVVYKSEKMVINLMDKGLACSDISTEAYIYKNRLVTAYFTANPIGLAQSDVVNAIVITDNTATADAMATAFVIMGKDRTIEYLAHHPELDAIITYLNSDNKLEKYLTEGIKDKYHLVE